MVILAKLIEIEEYDFLCSLLYVYIDLLFQQICNEHLSVACVVIGPALQYRTKQAETSIR